MALDDKPWWGKKDTLFGGETFRCVEVKPQDSLDLGIKIDDRFRVEKKGLSIWMTPHPANQGSLRDTDNQKGPIKLKEVEAPKFARAYSMEVNVTKEKTETKEFFFIERKNAITVIATSLEVPEAEEGCATVER